MPALSRTLRNGKSFLELDNSKPFRPKHRFDTKLLFYRVIEREDVDSGEESADTNSCSLPISTSRPPSAPEEPSPANLSAVTTPTASLKRLALAEGQANEYRSRKRAKIRQQRYEKKKVTWVGTTRLSRAYGGYVGVGQDPKGRTVDRPLQWFIDNGFELVKWNGSFSIPILDAESRCIAAAAKKPSSPQYEADIHEATHLIEEINQTTQFKSEEKVSKRGGGFPAVAYGISFGKGQLRPMRLNVARIDMMRRLHK
ncbi:hypothetical protein VKT23_013674 [Stygiomarasmius scandens]|uniref:Uncharacterized protein n=1 Tax=Marasmiellus scandens TaxID=2682957 RepID=A0ABR1J280_9AGAR